MPQLIGKYEVRGVIGGGSMSTVFLATDPDLNRTVAIKQLEPELASVPGFVDGFRAEAAIMGQLNHPNCVSVYDFLEVGGSAYLVSEYIAGASLRRILDDQGRLLPEQALAVTRGALSGLAFAHGIGLVHRDVKPENLLADMTGTSKLADFGQAVFTGEAGGGARQVTGSPAYMSPEQVRGEPGDVRSDVYSAGVVMFELLGGRAPFMALNRLAVMKMQLEREPPALNEVNPRVPSRLSAVVRQALSKEPRDRYSSAAEFLAVLEETAAEAYGSGWMRAGSIAGLVAAVTGATASAGSAAGTRAIQAGTASVGAAALATPSVGPGPVPGPGTPAAPAPAPAPVKPAGARGPGLGRGVAAAAAGLLVGVLVAVVAPPASLGLVPGRPSGTPTGAPGTALVGVSAISARFDNAAGTTYYALDGGHPGTSYTWGWVKQPACGALLAEPGGLTAAYQHQGCDPVDEGRGVVGVCAASGQASAVYQRNARYGDGAFTTQEALQAGIAEPGFSRVSSSASSDICSSEFAASALASPAPLVGASASPADTTSPGSSASPSFSPVPAAVPTGRRAAAVPLAVATAFGLLLAMLGLVLLQRGEPS